MRTRTTFWGVLQLLAMPLIAIAHPGHGNPANEPNGWKHYITEPYHVLVFLICVVGVYWVTRRFTKPAKAKRDYSSGRQM